MKNKFLSKLSLAVIMISFASSVNAQRLKLVEGNLDVLKSETKIKTQFTYDNMAVGKYKNEADYIKAKTDEYNSKEAGKGDKWAKAWIDDRAFRFEPKFNELFVKSSKMEISNDAKYTLIFNTSFTELGYNIGISRGNAYINGEATIVETANPGKVVAKVTVLKAPGRQFGGMDFDTGIRIAEAYADAGKALGKYVK